MSGAVGIMNKFWKRGLSLALIGTFSSGLVGNNVACAKWEGETVDIVINEKGVEQKITVPKVVDFSSPLPFKDSIEGSELFVKFDQPFNQAKLYRRAGVVLPGQTGTTQIEFRANEKVDKLTDELRTILKELANCDDVEKIHKLEEEYGLTSQKLAKEVIHIYRAKLEEGIVHPDYDKGIEEYYRKLRIEFFVLLSLPILSFVLFFIYNICKALRRNRHANNNNNNIDNMSGSAEYSSDVGSDYGDHGDALFPSNEYEEYVFPNYCIEADSSL